MPDSNYTGIVCHDCGKQLSEDERPCLQCGSSKRDISIVLNETITLQESFKAKHKDKSGFMLGVTTVREKISAFTKRKAFETLSYDHSNPNKTTKLHHVEELNDQGVKEVVHHHEETYPAKHRPKKD